MTKYNFFHSAHGGIIDGDNDELQLNYTEPVKLNIYVPNINPNKRFIFTIKSKSIIGTTTESGLETNEIIDQGLNNEFIQKFVEYLRFTIKDNMIEKVDVWNKNSRKRSKWNTFYGLDESGKMINKKIPNIQFNYNTDGDFKTGIVKLNLSEDNFTPISEWTPMAGNQDFNTMVPLQSDLSSISEEEEEDDLMSDNSINEDGSMMPMMGGTNDVGYLHYTKPEYSLISCIYSMLPSEEYISDEDVEITIYNSTCMYYKEDFETTEKKGIQKLMIDFPEWSKIYIISGDLLYELRNVIAQHKTDIQKITEVKSDVDFYINEMIKQNNMILNDILYQHLYEVLNNEGDIDEKTYLEILEGIINIIEEDHDFVINEIGPKINEILQRYSEEELFKLAKTMEISVKNYYEYEENGTLNREIINKNIALLDELMNDYTLNSAQYESHLSDIGLAEYKDDPSILNIIEQRKTEMKMNLKKYTNRLKTIKELKMLGFTSTDNFGRKNKRSLRLKKSGKSTTSRLRRSKRSSKVKK